jgi:ABC-type multidrug transport system permease subunit
MAAQAISALVLAGEAVSPTQFGISSAQASASGLTISPGLTAVFWVYCVFVVALAVACGWLFLSSRRAAVAAPPPPPPAARTAAEVSTYG